MVIGSWHISINTGGGADLWAAPIPHFYLWRPFPCSVPRPVPPLCSKGKYWGVWIRLNSLICSEFRDHFAALHSSSLAVFSCQHLLVLMAAFDWDRHSASLSWYCGVPSPPHTHLNIHAWLHVQLTFFFLSICLFFFTGEARNTALFFEHSYPSEFMPALVGNKLYCNLNCTFVTSHFMMVSLSSSVYITSEILALITPITSGLCYWGPCWTFTVAVLGNSLES